MIILLWKFQCSTKFLGKWSIFDHPSTCTFNTAFAKCAKNCAIVQNLTISLSNYKCYTCIETCTKTKLQFTFLYVWRILKVFFKKQNILTFSSFKSLLLGVKQKVARENSNLKQKQLQLADMMDDAWKLSLHSRMARFFSRLGCSLNCRYPSNPSKLCAWKGANLKFWMKLAKITNPI